MKNKIALLIRISILFLAWFKFQYNSFLNYFAWYSLIIKANIYSKLYKTQFFIVPKSKHSLMIVNYRFVGWYNKLRKKTKLEDKQKFDQFKMKRITISTLQDKSYFKTKKPG